MTTRTIAPAEGTDSGKGVKHEEGVKSILANWLKGWLPGMLPKAGVYNPAWIVILAAGFLIAGIVILRGQDGVDQGYATLWALAFLAIGALPGFLFAVPRVLRGKSDDESASADPDSKGGRLLRTNSNLEEISDWLTKIIVGVTLIQLGKIPGMVRDLAAFMADGMAAKFTVVDEAGQRTSENVVPGADFTPLAVAVILYFAALGFVAAYLVTRTYLAGILEQAEQGQRSPRDEGADEAGRGGKPMQGERGTPIPEPVVP